MAWIGTIGRELLGLFVDDGAFALAIIAWLLVMWAASSFGLEGRWTGVVLFAGFAAILIESALRRARQ